MYSKKGQRIFLKTLLRSFFFICCTSVICVNLGVCLYSRIMIPLKLLHGLIFQHFKSSCPLTGEMAPKNEVFISTKKIRESQYLSLYTSCNNVFNFCVNSFTVSNPLRYRPVATTVDQYQML